MITCHHNHTQKSCFYGPTLTPASHCVYKVPIAHLTHDDAKASTVYMLGMVVSKARYLDGRGKKQMLRKEKEEKTQL